MSDASIYIWRKQEKIDRGEVEGTRTDQALVGDPLNKKGLFPVIVKPG